jgi:hypothetical protein
MQAPTFFGSTYILPQYYSMLSHSPFYCLPPWIYFYFILYFLPDFHVLYIFLLLLLLCHFNSLYIPMLCDHSICFNIHKPFHTLILLSVIYFIYTTYSICISSNSNESKKLPDDGRPLPKHVGAW